MGLFGRFTDLYNMSKLEYNLLSHHFHFISQESKMIATPASVERVEKCVFNFEIYCFLKNAANLPHSPLLCLLSVEQFILHSVPNG